MLISFDYWTSCFQPWWKNQSCIVQKNIIHNKSHQWLCCAELCCAWGVQCQVSVTHPKTPTLPPLFELVTVQCFNQVEVNTSRDRYWSLQNQDCNKVGWPAVRTFRATYCAMTVWKYCRGMVLCKLFILLRWNCVIFWWLMNSDLYKVLENTLLLPLLSASPFIRSPQRVDLASSICHMFLCRMPFLTQPSPFIQAWDRHKKYTGYTSWRIQC